VALVTIQSVCCQIHHIDHSNDPKRSRNCCCTSKRQPVVNVLRLGLCVYLFQVLTTIDTSTQFYSNYTRLLCFCSTTSACKKLYARKKVSDTQMVAAFS
jgi:hypothetical protein